MKKISTLIIASIVAWGVLLPTLLFAQERIGVSDITGGLNSGKKIIDTLNDTIVKSLAALLMSSALLVFFAGIVEYIWGKRQGDSGKVKTGNEFMTWGLVALFVMFSVYGIIKLGQSVLFGTKDVNTIDIPTFNFRRGTSGDVQVGNSSPGFQPGAGTPTSGFGVGGSGGTLNLQQNHAQQVYDTCIKNGHTSSDCNAAYKAQGGSGIGGCPTGETYDSDTGQCVQSIFGTRSADTNTSGCPSGQQYDSFGNCEIIPTIQSSGSGGASSESTSGAYACDPQDESCNNSGAPVTRDVSNTCTDNGGTLRSDGSCDMGGGGATEDIPMP